MKGSNHNNGVLNGHIETLGADRVLELMQFGLRYEKMRERAKATGADQRERARAMKQWAIENGFKG